MKVLVAGTNPNYKGGGKTLQSIVVTTTTGDIKVRARALLVWGVGQVWWSCALTPFVRVVSTVQRHERCSTARCDNLIVLTAHTWLRSAPPPRRTRRASQPPMARMLCAFVCAFRTPRPRGGQYELNGGGYKGNYSVRTSGSITVETVDGYLGPSEGVILNNDVLFNGQFTITSRTGDVDLTFLPSSV